MAFFSPCDSHNSPLFSGTIQTSMRYLFVLLLLISYPLLSPAQQLSPSSTVSLLTVAPGAELYSAFGHTAVRVHDPLLGIDEVFNYGTFDFNAPNFYLKFMQGKLNYMIDKDRWKDFNYAYHYFKRSFEEQQLDLNLDQRQAVFEYLNTNSLPENRFYLYDFFFDNCATRLRDILESELKEDLRWGPPTKSGASFRDYLHEYLKEKSWIAFGIDIVLGVVTDREADVREQMFLPDYLASAFDGAEVKGPNGWRPLVASRDTLYEGEDQVEPTPWFLHPVSVMLLLLLLMGWYSWRRFKGQENIVPDIVFWIVLGIAGLIPFLLWFATEHTATVSNVNLLWVNPLHLIAGIALMRKAKPGWLKWYFLVVGGIAAILLVFGAFFPQDFQLGFYPIFAVIAMRGIMLYRELG